MKHHVLISLEMEVWLKAKRKSDNLSATVNDLLKKWAEVADDINKKESERLKLELMTKEAEFTAIRKQLDEMQEKEKERKSKVIKVIGGSNAITNRRWKF